MVLCVGSSTKDRPKDFGLRLFSFDKETGQLTLLANGAQGRSPTFAVFGNGFIYAVDEQDEGGRSGRVHLERRRKARACRRLRSARKRHVSCCVVA